MSVYDKLWYLAPLGYDTSHVDAALHYYETLHADELVHSNHPLPGRQLVTFQALGKDFKLHLQPNRRMLGRDFVVHEVNEHGHKVVHKVDQDTFLHGFLEGG